MTACGRNRSPDPGADFQNACSARETAFLRGILLANPTYLKKGICISIMDRKLEKKTWTPKFIVLLTGGIALLSFVAFQFLFADNRSSLNVDRERISVATVNQGEFTDYIPVSGNMEPAETFYLDAIEIGRAHV